MTHSVNFRFKGNLILYMRNSTLSTGLKQKSKSIRYSQDQFENHFYKKKKIKSQKITNTSKIVP